MVVGGWGFGEGTPSEMVPSRYGARVAEIPSAPSLLTAVIQFNSLLLRCKDYIHDLLRAVNEKYFSVNWIPRNWDRLLSWEIG